MNGKSKELELEGAAAVADDVGPKRLLIAQDIVERIRSGAFKAGARLPPMEELAKFYSVSIRTVYQALEELESLGYVSKRHGFGTVVAGKRYPLTLRDTVVVCMESKAHVFGELFGEIMNRLHGRQMAPIAIDTSHYDSATLIQRLRHTQALCYLVHSTESFPHHVFAEPSMEGTHVVAFITWHGESEWPGLFRVLSDFEAGGRMVADFLWSRGHRKILVLGTATGEFLMTKPEARTFFVGVSFAERWNELGGRLIFLRSYEDLSSPSMIALDAGTLMRQIESGEPATALFGTRDVEIWQAQQIISELRPALLPRIMRVGYYDTPWSRMADPPFTTVSLDLPTMADVGLRIVDSLRSGRFPDASLVKITPKLVLR